MVGCVQVPGVCYVIWVLLFSDGIPVYIYKANQLESNPKILVYFHGGGMALGTRLNYDTCCNTIAQ